MQKTHRRAHNIGLDVGEAQAPVTRHLVRGGGLESFRAQRQGGEAYASREEGSAVYGRWLHSAIR